MPKSERRLAVIAVTNVVPSSFECGQLGSTPPRPKRPFDQNCVPEVGISSCQSRTALHVRRVWVAIRPGEIPAY